jgi:hypothetical protein
MRGGDLVVGNPRRRRKQINPATADRGAKRSDMAIPIRMTPQAAIGSLINASDVCRITM